MRVCCSLIWQVGPRHPGLRDAHRTSLWDSNARRCCRLVKASIRVPAAASPRATFASRRPQGAPPFADENGDDMKTYQNITRGNLAACYSDDERERPTSHARSLIQGLCTVKVAFRLGYLKGGAEDVMAQRWFDGYDWAGLVNQTKEPPWRPQLARSDDTQCFEDAAGGDSLDGPASGVRRPRTTRRRAPERTLPPREGGRRTPHACLRASVRVRCCRPPLSPAARAPLLPRLALTRSRSASRSRAPVLLCRRAAAAADTSKGAPRQMEEAARGVCGRGDSA
jgi:hypothetical protein